MMSGSLKCVILSINLSLGIRTCYVSCYKLLKQLWYKLVAWQLLIQEGSHFIGLLVRGHFTVVGSVAPSGTAGVMLHPFTCI